MKHILNFIKNINNQHNTKKPPIPHGLKGINLVGHRQYVGGLWEEIGNLQFDFLIKQGLKPSDVLIDIACGSLRAGVHLIPFLQKGHYLGIDKESRLIELGLKNEIKEEIINDKKPEFIITKDFEFNKFNLEPNFAIAQSLFTHLPPHLIVKCLKSLKKNFAKNGIFFATFFIVENQYVNPKKPHDHGIFKYTVKEIKKFGLSCGWNVTIIGKWNHPRDQQMVKFTPIDLTSGISV